MANQMIALQAKAPDMPSFTDYIQIREHAQDRQNAMLKQQQEQNAMLRKQAEADAMNNAYGQALDPATGRIDANKLSSLLAQGGFGSSIPGVQQELSKAQGEQTKTSAAQLEHLMKFSEASRSEFGNAASPDDAIGRAQRLAQAFPDMAPHLQAGLADMPKDPAGFAAWKQDVLRKNLTAEQQLKQQFFKIEDATGQHILSVPEVGGAARIVEGSRTSSAPKTQFVWGANGGQVVDTSKPGPVMAGGGGPASVDSLLPAIVQQESRGNYGAVNSSTGAMGAYQVMPATGKSLAGQLGLPWRPELMTSPSPAGRQYQDAIGKAAVAEAVAASGGDVGTAAAYYHGGSDRAKWGPKTRQYAQEVAARVSGGGQIKAVGGGTPDGLTSKGYRIRPDGSMEVIPGGPADPGTVEMPSPKEIQKRNATFPKVTAAYRGATQKIDQQIADLEALKKDPGLNSIVGSIDSLVPNVFPAATRAQARLNKIMARGQFNELQDMRNNSPTGGALGSISDGENKTLRQAAAALDQAQGEGDFIAAVDEYISALKYSKNNIQSAYDDTYAYRAATDAAARRPAAPRGNSDIDAILSKYGVK